MYLWTTMRSPARGRVPRVRALGNRHMGQTAGISLKANQKLLKEWKGVYQKLTPEAANSIADRVFTLDEERVGLHQKYLGLMSEKVSTVVAVQFLQVQRRFEKMADLKASTYIPIAGM